VSRGIISCDYTSWKSASGEVSNKQRAVACNAAAVARGYAMPY